MQQKLLLRRIRIAGFRAGSTGQAGERNDRLVRLSVRLCLCVYLCDFCVCVVFVFLSVFVCVCLYVCVCLSVCFLCFQVFVCVSFCQCNKSSVMLQTHCNAFMQQNTITFNPLTPLSNERAADFLDSNGSTDDDASSSQLKGFF